MATHGGWPWPPLLKLCALLALAGVACGGSRKAAGPDMSRTSDATTAVGAEGGLCFSNNTCHTGLSCVYGICLRLQDGGPNDRSRAPSKEGGVYLDWAVVKPAPTACADSKVEPNNSGSTATPLTFIGLSTGWEICYPGDVDQYAIPLAAGQKLTVVVDFYHTKGDIDAALVAPDGTLTSSRSKTDDEVLTSKASTSAGTYILGVWGFGDAMNTYDLKIQITN